MIGYLFVRIFVAGFPSDFEGWYANITLILAFPTTALCKYRRKQDLHHISEYLTLDDHCQCFF